MFSEVFSHGPRSRPVGSLHPTKGCTNRLKPLKWHFHRSRTTGLCRMGIRHPAPSPSFPNVFGGTAVRATVGKAWVKDRRRDPYYRRAKSQGYRSRAAFKLIQIDARFDLIYEGDAVVDLGAAPGGWSQVAKFLVGDTGSVVAVDRIGMRPIDGVEGWRGGAPGRGGPAGVGGRRRPAPRRLAGVGPPPPGGQAHPPPPRRDRARA